MNYVGRLLSNFKGFYNEINSATLTGAIDIVIVQQDDGSYATSPWHVRFGKLGVLRSRQKVVDIEINGEPADIQMKLGEAGEAFFVEKASDDNSADDEYLATSPLPDPDELIAGGLQLLHEQVSDTIISIDGKPADTIIPIDLPEVEELTTPTADVIEMGACNNVVQATVSLLDPSRGSPDLLQELTVDVSDQNVGTEVVEFSSSSLFRPVSEKSRTDIGIQTDMTGVDVETKAATRSQLPSENSCQSCNTSTSASQASALSPQSPPSSKDGPTSKMPSFIRLDSENELTKKAREKKRRRRKKPSHIHGSKIKTAATSLDVRSTESGSSCEIPEEGMFDLELSGDEVDNAIYLNSMGRTVSMPLIDNKFARTDEWASSQYAASFHPFSDGDITPIVSPVGTRPPSPKSDTEYEKAMKYDATCQTQLTGDELETIDAVRWRWGELPESDNVLAPSTARTAEEKPSGGLFQFMRKTKKIRHQPQQEGIYLDDLDLNEMDPEVAALYLYQGKSAQTLRPPRDEDNESGRGASLPQSPVTVDDGNSLSPNSGMSDIAVSLCGGLKESEGHVPHEKFLQGLVTYDEFCENPSIFEDPNLVIKMADKYYNWQVAGPIIMSVVIFQRPLPDRSIEGLVKQHMPKKETKKRGWMWWGRSGAESSQAAAAKKEDLANLPSSGPTTAPNSPQNGDKDAKKPTKDDGSTDDGSEAGTDDSVPIPLPDSVSVATQMSPPIKSKDFRKTLKLSSEKIASLKLKPGTNDVSFSVTTQYQGTSRCTAYIYLWNWDDKIIISDIDGTITKSDVLGQVLPMIGKDWSQVGIANLYNQIEKNGYRFIYLSARAIGQSKITRDYLRSIRQGELGLPHGPLLLSPSSLISAFHKEVIERRPQDFKISCLRDIKALFPTSRNPFYAGFGNKINDVWAYQAVNIPITRIFTVNHKGELRHELTCTFQSTYTKMTDTVDHLCPPLIDKSSHSGKVHSGNFPAPDEYSNFTYWREPLPDIETDLEAIVGPKEKQEKSKK